MAKEYDVVVLGAGPGGYVAAIRAAQLGLKTAIVEKQWWGGVCLNVGCIPSKALLYNAELAHILRHRAKDFGFSFDNLKLDYATAFKRSRQSSERLVKGVGFLMRKNKIETYDGWGTFKDARTLEVELGDGNKETLQAKNVIIATGATTRLLPGTQVSERVITYLEAILSDRLPRSIIIAGASAIGVEFAYIMNSYGVDVTLVEYLPRLVPLEDEEVSKELEKQFKRIGIKCMPGTKVESVQEQSDKVRVTVTTADGEEQTLEAEQVLQAIGVQPRTEGYGLENTGVALDEKTRGIAIDEYMRTNVEGVYAIGDVTGKLMLAHVASAMALVAAEAIAGVDTVTLDYKMMPRATYCQPQIASFGYTEAEAREAGYEINVSKFPFQANGKALGMGERDGFVKLISDRKYGEMLGGHLIGANVTELLPELTLARFAELTPYEIARNVHPHPTLSEMIMEAAHGLEGEMINL